MSTTIPADKRLSNPAVNTEWMARRDCVTDSVDTDYWFSESLTPVDRTLGHKIAVDTCGTCPVKQECLDFAIIHGERFGIWGGRDFRTQPMCRLCTRVIRLYATGCTPEAIIAQVGHTQARLRGCLIRHGNAGVAQDLGWDAPQPAAKAPKAPA